MGNFSMGEVLLVSVLFIVIGWWVIDLVKKLFKAIFK